MFFYTKNLTILLSLFLSSRICYDNLSDFIGILFQLSSSLTYDCIFSCCIALYDGLVATRILSTGVIFGNRIRFFGLLVFWEIRSISLKSFFFFFFYSRR